MARRIRFEQYTTAAITGAFVEVAKAPGDNYWHAKIRDAIIGDEPEFVFRTPKTSKHAPFTAQEVAQAARGQCNEGTGRVLLTRVENGVPVFSGLWWSPVTLHPPVCVKSSDHAVAQPIVMAGLAERATAAIAAARAARSRE